MHDNQSQALGQTRAPGGGGRSLHKTGGVVENLRVVHTKRNILYGPQMQEVAGVSSILFALAGMSSAAVQTSMNADGGADDVDLYIFEIDGCAYAGCTRGLSLMNDDEVELVYEARPRGNEVLAVRRPATRSIWLCPYMSRGSIAAALHALRLWVVFSLCGWGGGVLIGLGDLTQDDVLLGLAVSFGGTALAASWMLPRFFRFSRIADEVFTAFGYATPKHVDLQRTSKTYRRANKIRLDWANKAELWY